MMAGSFKNILGTLIFFISFITISRGYQRLSIEDECLANEEITLGTGNISGLIVTLRNITTLKERINKQKDDFTCEFHISISEDDKGLFAVVQNMFLRKNDTTNECIDYIEYRRNDGSYGRKYCGQMGYGYQFHMNNLVITPNSFVEDIADSLDVYVSISKTPLEADENLELEIVFTSFRSCLINISDDQLCIPTDKNYCIYKEFISDGYVNCPFSGCVSGKECVRETQNTNSSLSAGTILIICLGVLTLLILMLEVWFICVLKRCPFRNSNGNTPQALEMYPMVDM